MAYTQSGENSRTKVQNVVADSSGSKQHAQALRTYRAARSWYTKADRSYRTARVTGLRSTYASWQSAQQENNAYTAVTF